MRAGTQGYIRRQTVKSRSASSRGAEALRGPGAGPRDQALAREKQLYEVLTQLIDWLGSLQTTAGALASSMRSPAWPTRLRARWTRPTGDRGAYCHRGGRPRGRTLLDAPFVPNDLRLDTDAACSIITGPNMGGKSTYMPRRAHCGAGARGSYVPAERAVLGPLDRIFTRIGRR